MNKIVTSTATFIIYLFIQNYLTASLHDIPHYSLPYLILKSHLHDARTRVRALHCGLARDMDVIDQTNTETLVCKWSHCLNEPQFTQRYNIIYENPKFAIFF